MSLIESIKDFLESSSIHGLVYWSTTRSLNKLFWILVVITGFSGAGYFIQQSFQGWKESPIKTTVETLPISEVSFPKITVCPPEDTYTNLNYDLQQAENKSIDFNKNSFEMTDEFVQHFLEIDFKNYSLKQTQGLKEHNRFRNWYEKTRYLFVFILFSVAIVT